MVPRAEQRWTIHVCPDPECGDWYDELASPGTHCTNYDVHNLGDYPKLDEVEVVPAAAADRLAEALRDIQESAASGGEWSLLAIRKRAEAALAGFSGSGGEE